MVNDFGATQLISTEHALPGLTLHRSHKGC